jgi:hypothetical protein
MPRANPQQDKKYYSYDPRQTHSDFHNKIGPSRHYCQQTNVCFRSKATFNVDPVNAEFTSFR